MQTNTLTVKELLDLIRQEGNDSSRLNPQLQIQTFQGNWLNLSLSDDKYQIVQWTLSLLGAGAQSMVFKSLRKVSDKPEEVTLYIKGKKYVLAEED